MDIEAVRKRLSTVTDLKHKNNKLVETTARKNSNPNFTIQTKFRYSVY